MKSLKIIAVLLLALPAFTGCMSLDIKKGQEHSKTAFTNLSACNLKALTDNGGHPDTRPEAERLADETYLDPAKAHTVAMINSAQDACRAQFGVEVSKDVPRGTAIMAEANRGFDQEAALFIKGQVTRGAVARWTSEENKWITEQLNQSFNERLSYRQQQRNNVALAIAAGAAAANAQAQANRPPPPVSCISNRMGNTVYTSCN